MNASLVRVKRQAPCPICGKPDWCSMSDDGAMAICMRVAETQAATVARVRSLFRSCPPGNFLGGALAALAGKVVDYLLSRALIAAYRDQSHKSFIAVARWAARIAERWGDM